MSPENETFIIPAHPPLCEEMKLYNILDQPMQGELGEISEWAARKALWDYPVGSEQSLEEVTNRAHNIQFQLVLSKMVDLRSLPKRDPRRASIWGFLFVGSMVVLSHNWG